MSIRSVLLSLTLFFSLSSSAVSSAGEARPVEIQQGDKCAVCGMFVSRYPGWIAQIIFTDGTYAVFDGPKDMFRYYFNLNKYNASKKQSDILSLYVTEYYSNRLIDAKKAFFISGSDVYGPMGVELIPVAGEKNAKEFLRDHKGRNIRKFGEITEGDLN